MVPVLCRWVNDCQKGNGLKLHVDLEEGVGLSTGRRCSLKRSLSRLFVSPMYCLLQRRQCIM